MLICYSVAISFNSSYQCIGKSGGYTKDGMSDNNCCEGGSPNINNCPNDCGYYCGGL